MWRSPRHGCVSHKIACFLVMAVSLRTQGTQRQRQARELLTTAAEETAMAVCLDPSRNQSRGWDRGASMHQVTLCDSVFNLCQGCSQLCFSAVKIKIQLVKLLQNALTAFSLVFLTLSHSVLCNLYGTKVSLLLLHKDSGSDRRLHYNCRGIIFTRTAIVCSCKKPPLLQKLMRRDILNLR